MNKEYQARLKLGPKVKAQEEEYFLFQKSVFSLRHQITCWNTSQCTTLLFMMIFSLGGTTQYKIIKSWNGVHFSNMYHFRKLCKIRFLNSELGNFKYLRFYWTFQHVILSGSLKTQYIFNFCPCNASIMSNTTWNNWLKCSYPSIFHHICYGKSEAKIFKLLQKFNYLICKLTTQLSSGLDLLLNIIKKMTNLLNLNLTKRSNLESLQHAYHAAVITNKPNFPFRHTENVYRTTHVASY